MAIIGGVILYLMTVALIVAFGRFLHECDNALSNRFTDEVYNRKRGRL